jgi:hypothetical protein
MPSPAETYYAHLIGVQQLLLMDPVPKPVVKIMFETAIIPNVEDGVSGLNPAASAVAIENIFRKTVHHSFELFENGHLVSCEMLIRAARSMMEEIGGL